MTTRKMFEYLGFEYQEDKYFISYNYAGEKKKKTPLDLDLEFEVVICFNKEGKCYKAYLDDSPLEIDMLTMQAIIKQCEELGWL